jgi:uncharacterized membrane protein YbhN (UPF0104 family)
MIAMMRRWALPLAKFGVTVLLLWLLLRKIDLNMAWQAARGISPVALLIAFALLTLQVGLCGLRWQMVVKALGARLGFVKATAVFEIGLFFGLLLPGAIAGDMVRMWTVHRAGLPMAAAINSVILERLAALMALVALVTASEPLLAARVPHAAGLWVFPALTALGIAGAGSMMLLDRLPAALLRRRLLRGLVRLASDTRLLYLKPRNCLPVIAVALLGHLNLGLGAYALARGLSIDISMLDCVILFMPAVLVSMLPITIAGWGAREATLVVLFGFVGVPAAQALALSVLYGLSSMLIALPGGLLWFVLPGRRTAQAVDRRRSA